MSIYKKYAAKQADNPNMTFIGRCGMYVYIDMHQAINSSLQTAKKFIERVK
jgi:UDP-galactopyranose mutase